MKRKLRGLTGGLSCCGPLQVAILVPFRNRHEHLPVLLRHLIPMLQRQRLRFAFYVVEQVSGLFLLLLSLLTRRSGCFQPIRLRRAEPVEPKSSD